MKTLPEPYASTGAGTTVCRHLFIPPVPEPSGRVLLLQGLGDHLGCHRRAAELFASRGLLGAGVDWPGHGRSEGKRGHIANLEVTHRLIEETLERLGEIGGRSGPTLLYAHSTGAFFCLDYLRTMSRPDGASRFDGVWLSSPLLQPAHGQPSLLVKAAPWIARLAPTLTFDTGVRPERCRHLTPESAADPAEALCHHRVSAALGAALLAASVDLPELARALTDPLRVLITQGEEDTICPPAFSREFFRAIPAVRKTYALLPGLRHECLREPDPAPVLDAAAAWLDSAL